MPRVGIDFEGNTAGFDKATQKVTRDLQKWEAQAKSISKGVNASLGAIGAGVSLAGITALIKKNIDFADNLRDLSKKTNVYIEDLAGLDLAAKQSGTSLEDVAKSINKLSINIGKDGDKFRDLGITAKSPIEAFEQLADVLNGIDDDQTRAAVAAAALGKSWENVAPLLAEGSESIKDMVEEGKRLTPVTKEMGDAADAFNDDLEAMTKSLSSVGISLTGPVLNGFNQLITQIKTATQEGVSFNNVLQGVINFATQADTSTRGLIQSQIDLTQKKIAAMQGNGAIGGLIDDFTGQDVNLEKNRLDVLKSKLAEYDAQQKKVIETAQGLAKPSQTAIDAVLGKDGSGKIDKAVKDAKELDRILAGLRFVETGSIGYNNKATSTTGAKGTYQITTGFRKEAEGLLGRSIDPRNDKQAEAAVKVMLEKYLDKYDGDLAKSVLAFSGVGPGGVDKAVQQGGVDFLRFAKMQRPEANVSPSEYLKRFQKGYDLAGGSISDLLKPFEEQQKAQEQALKDAEEYSKLYTGILSGLENEIADSRLPEIQRQIVQEERAALQQLGLDKDILTDKERQLAAAIHDTIEKQKLENLQAEENKEWTDKLIQAKLGLGDVLDGLVDSETYSDQLALWNDLLKKNLITTDEFKKIMGQITQEFNKTPQAVQDASNEMSEFAKEAARNMQDTFADFLFDPFKDGLGGMVDNFATALRRMAANALATQLTEGLLGKDGKSGLLGGLFSGASSSGGSSFLSGAGSLFSSLFSSLASFDTGTPFVPKDGIAFIHKGEKIIPAAHNSRGTDPFNGGGNNGSNITVVQHISVGQNSDRGMVKQAAGQGAREALGAFSSMQRYK
jgi:hypothetical protein